MQNPSAVAALLLIAPCLASSPCQPSAALLPQGGSSTPLFETLGNGTPGTNGIPALSTNGSPVVGAPFDVFLEGGLGGSPAGLIWSLSEEPVFVPSVGNFAYPKAPSIFHSFGLDQNGSSAPLLAFSAVPANLHGLTIVAQAFVFDPQAQGSFSTTAGLRIRFGNAPGGSPLVSPVASPTAATSVLVSGTGQAGASVLIQGGASEVTGPIDSLGNWSLSVPLKQNAVNMLFVSALFSAGGESPPTTLEIVQDGAPPKISIDYPEPGADFSVPFTNVSGRVSDLLSGFAGLTVTVNGQPAVVDAGIGTNGTFQLHNAPLVIGMNTIVAQAMDAVGNVAATTVKVEHKLPTGNHLIAISGDDQTVQVDSLLPQPIVVKYVNGAGVPLPGRLLRFTVTKSNGKISPNGVIAGEQTVDVISDSGGFAQVLWTIGSDAGCGNNRLRVEAAGLAAVMDFSASGTVGPATQINVGMGNEQVGEAGGGAPMPLRVWVNDGCNGVGGVPVTFSVQQSNAALTGGSGIYAKQVVVETTSTGHAQATLLLDAAPGTNIVKATLEGSSDQEAVFLVRGIAANEATTSFTGAVFDNARQPLQNATCTLRFTGSPNLVTTTDAAGVFSFQAIPDSGLAKLEIDGASVVTVGKQFPRLEFEPFVVSKAKNSLSRPVVLPPLLNENLVSYDGSSDVVLKMSGVEGLSLSIEAGSVIFPDGVQPTPQNPLAIPRLLSINPVQTEEIPMPMPDGASPPVAWTVQPGGTHFDPPARVSYPNLAGLAPGSVANILTFDHDTSRFEIISSATVSADGALIESDSGAGLTLAGWGGICPPYPAVGNISNKSFHSSGSVAGPSPALSFQAGRSICVRVTKTSSAPYVLSVSPPSGESIELGTTIGTMELNFTEPNPGVAVPIAWNLQFLMPAGATLSYQIRSTDAGSSNLGVNQDWTLFANGQSTTPDNAGGYSFSNVAFTDNQPPFSVGDEFLRVTGERNDQQLYCFSVDPEFQMLNGTTVIAPPFLVTGTPPLNVVGLQLTIDNSVLSLGGAMGPVTTELRPLAVLSDDTQVDVKLRSAWTFYSTSNASIATVDVNGSVTAIAPGTVYLGAKNGGALAGVKLLVVDDLTAALVAGIVRDTANNPVSGSSVVLSALSTTSAFNGGFSFAGVPASTFNTLPVWASHQNPSTKEWRHGISAPLMIDSGAFFTPAGDIILRPCGFQGEQVGSFSGSYLRLEESGDGRLFGSSVDFQLGFLDLNVFNTSYPPVPDLCSSYSTIQAIELLSLSTPDRLFVADGATLRSYDAQEPCVALSSLQTVGGSYFGSVSAWQSTSLPIKKYLYAPVGWFTSFGRLDIFDISGVAIQPVGSVAFSGDLGLSQTAVSADGSRVYLFSHNPVFGPTLLYAFDTSDPENPLLIDVLDLAPSQVGFIDDLEKNHIHVAPNGDYVYISNRDEMFLVDVTGPMLVNLGAVPGLPLSQIEGLTPFCAQSLLVWGSNPGDESSSIFELDISNPATPTWNPSSPLIETGTDVREAHVDRGIIYVSGEEQTLVYL
jgi:hypothetical protein